MCAYHCAQLSYTTQHRAVLIIFPLILQTSTRAHMLSIGGKRGVENNVRTFNTVAQAINSQFAV